MGLRGGARAVGVSVVCQALPQGTLLLLNWFNATQLVEPLNKSGPRWLEYRVFPFLHNVCTRRYRKKHKENALCKSSGSPFLFFGAGGTNILKLGPVFFCRGAGGGKVFSISETHYST